MREWNIKYFGVGYNSAFNALISTIASNELNKFLVKRGWWRDNWWFEILVDTPPFIAGSVLDGQITKAFLSIAARYNKVPSITYTSNGIEAHKLDRSWQVAYHVCSLGLVALIAIYQAKVMKENQVNLGRLGSVVEAIIPFNFTTSTKVVTLCALLTVTNMLINIYRNDFLVVLKETEEDVKEPEKISLQGYRTEYEKEVIKPRNTIYRGVNGNIPSPTSDEAIIIKRAIGEVVSIGNWILFFCIKNKIQATLTCNIYDQVVDTILAFAIPIRNREELAL